MKRGWQRKSKSWLEVAGTVGTLGPPVDQIERAMKSEASAERGVGGYAAFSAPEKVPAPARPEPAEASTEASGPTPAREERAGEIEREESEASRQTNEWVRQQLGEMDRLRRMLTQEREEKWQLQQMLDDPELRVARAEMIRGIVELVPQAIADAKKGKPALLRLISRAVGLRRSPSKLPGS